MRSIPITNLKDMLEEANCFARVYPKIVNYRTASEFPIAMLFIPEQEVEHKTTQAGPALGRLKSNFDIVIRLVTEINPDNPESEMDGLIEEVLELLVNNHNLNNTVRTTDPYYIQTAYDITDNMGFADMFVRVQI